MIKATWYISLNCDCPGCDEAIDLLDYPDFWDSHSGLAIGENGSALSNIEVECPKCHFNFAVECVY